MKKSLKFRHFLGAAVLAAALSPALATAQTAETYTPSVGQMGKDVVWVPTPDGLVDRMLDMAKVTKQDFLIDLGSGDGRTVIAAAKRGVKALGVEYNPDMVRLSRTNAQNAGVTNMVEFVHGDIFEYNFSKATVLTLFLLPHLNVKLRPIILDMKPGTRVVSNSFDMGDWNPDERAEAKGECTSYCRAMLWIVPAKVGGEWSGANGRLSLNQTYQTFAGSITMGGSTSQITSGKINADAVEFEAGGKRYKGKVDGNRMSGTIEGSKDTWTMTRAAAK
jgi:hypothetical protein